eukprot:scaffold230290_cov31-Tisochrysis_lutea.AAC.1
MMLSICLDAVMCTAISRLGARRGQEGTSANPDYRNARVGSKRDEVASGLPSTRGTGDLTLKLEVIESRRDEEGAVGFFERGRDGSAIVEVSLNDLDARQLAELESARVGSRAHHREHTHAARVRELTHDAAA